MCSRSKRKRSRSLCSSTPADFPRVPDGVLVLVRLAARRERQLEDGLARLARGTENELAQRLLHQGMAVGELALQRRHQAGPQVTAQGEQERGALGGRRGGEEVTDDLQRVVVAELPQQGRGPAAIDGRGFAQDPVEELRGALAVGQAPRGDLPVDADRGRLRAAAASRAGRGR